MDNDASKAFKQLKEFLTKPHVLTVPDDGETLLLYIAVTIRVVSMVLVIKCYALGQVYKVQRPVNFISEVLGYSKVRYPQVLYAILVTSRKLQH